MSPNVTPKLAMYEFFHALRIIIVENMHLKAFARLHCLHVNPSKHMELFLKQSLLAAYHQVSALISDEQAHLTGSLTLCSETASVRRSPGRMKILRATALHTRGQDII
jgi:hypothetical protein